MSTALVPYRRAGARPVAVAALRATGQTPFTILGRHLAAGLQPGLAALGAYAGAVSRTIQVTMRANVAEFERAMAQVHATLARRADRDALTWAAGLLERHPELSPARRRAHAHWARHAGTPRPRNRPGRRRARRS